MRHKPVFLGVILILSANFPAAQERAPVFEPVKVDAHIYDGGWEHFVGGGVATFDCNDDDFPDFFAAGGTNPAQLFINRTGQSGNPVKFSAHTPSSLAQTGVLGAYPLDINGDQLLDLAILRVGPDILMKGLGDCKFEPFSNLGFQSADHWTTAFSATWEKGNTLPTLAFGTYVDRTNPDGPFEACDDTLLYRPVGEGYGDAQALSPGFCSLSILFSDWKRSGTADLRISNDRHYYVRGGQEQMWKMDGEPRLYRKDEGWKEYRLWGMGIASRDMNSDGFNDVFLTSIGDQKFQLFDPHGDGPTWKDVTYEFGTTAHRPHLGDEGRPSTGWHVQFADVNLDGRDDIFIAKGNVEQMPDAAIRDPNSLLMQQPDGRFVEKSHVANIATMERSRGASLADLNRDGTLDLIVVNRRAPLEIYQNKTLGGNWILIDVVGNTPNTRAIGAFLEVEFGNGRHTREITVGGGHASGSALPHHFGLGNHETARVRLISPDGTPHKWKVFSANQHITLRAE